MNEVVSKAEIARRHSLTLAGVTTTEKNEALLLIAAKLEEYSGVILDANRKDVTAAQNKSVSKALIDRLTLTEDRITGMVDSIRLLTDLEDPSGKTLSESRRPNGLLIKKTAVPIGVIGMIYEARPNVTIDAATLALKTGNAILLRGSSSTIHSNKAILSLIHDALSESSLPPEAVQLIEDPDRELLKSLYNAKGLVDVLIPRGGKELIDTVVENSRVPVLETGAGNCHVYIDAEANPEMAISIVVNSKTQRPSVCNACETVIIHEDWAQKHLGNLIEALQEKHVVIRGDEQAAAIQPGIQAASQTDWEEEFLDLIVAVKIVPSLDDAIKHIELFGTKHSEAIVSESSGNVEKFFTLVDASVVYHNASTRFTDGFEFGFGAEIGISTQKLHARGPMGLEALTTVKYQVYGTGQIK
ncbi:glutamate-5-semialdehyde dehydrogenase [Salipaludibacillus aurantiacus]|uniref:Gamma-glutamyl phosphate reductase n=1 Tax=Salipaludibacillus aurantiacus TaxID=1601833 RepID=A0A1H9VRJ5_9BACI|nr:glutamate-5-semialdehyde dehydrogenase [Salipaludibacillus aurantiacus]SES24202.1 glutamate-5-semialdehyde dehydrogenase [Salipaludibacillus aurantiacus]